MVDLVIHDQIRVLGVGAWRGEARLDVLVDPGQLTLTILWHSFQLADHVSVGKPPMLNMETANTL